MFLLFKKFWKTELYHSDPLSLSILSGDRLDVDRIFENTSVTVLLYLFLSGKAHKYLPKLSIITNIYLNPSLFNVL